MFGLASLITLGIIFGFVFVIILMIANFIGAASMPFVIGMTVAINLLGWLISPYLMDFTYRFFYKTDFLTFDDFKNRYPKLADFVSKLCEKHSLKLPKIRLIADDNPTAFVYGSGAFNARMALSHGIFEYLDEDEIEGVVAHELGHIKRRDFIIMTIAATGVQILYELSQLAFRRGGRDDKKNAAASIALVAYVFYIVGSYLLLFLSRTREHGADRFSAEHTGNPDCLSRALVKIAYGIVAKPDTAEQQRLLMSTRALGMFDPKLAKDLGVAFESSKRDFSAIAQVMTFDLVSPWAKIMELQSTHPLTGKRIRKMSELCLKMGKTPSFDFNTISTMKIDRRKLYHGFASGVVIHFLPWLLPLAALVFSLSVGDDRHLFALPAALGIGIFCKLLYKYPLRVSATPVTTLEAMTDIYASPVRGRKIALRGEIIGRGNAGAHFSEDLMLRDKTGLIFLNYESAFAFVGNLMFALGKVKKLLNRDVSLEGWFFRDVSHHVDLDVLQTENGETIKSHPILFAALGALIAIAASGYLYARYPVVAIF